MRGSCLLSSANPRRREWDDSPPKVPALFDMRLDKFGLIKRTLLRLPPATCYLSTGVSCEKLPPAALCDVWDVKLERHAA